MSSVYKYSFIPQPSASTCNEVIWRNKTHHCNTAHWSMLLFWKRPVSFCLTVCDLTNINHWFAPCFHVFSWSVFETHIQRFWFQSFPEKSYPTQGTPLPPDCLQPVFPAAPHQAGIPALLSHSSVLPSQLRASTDFQYFRNADALPCRHAGTKNRRLQARQCVSRSYLQLRLFCVYGTWLFCVCVWVNVDLQSDWEGLQNRKISNTEFKLGKHFTLKCMRKSKS